MITNFGKILRKIRIDNNEILKTMADTLNVTASFLSAVENGKKKIPDHWLSQICSFYNLSSSQIEELEFAFSQSNENLKIPFTGLNDEHKKLAFAFARKLDTFDTMEIEKLKAILEGDKNSL